MWFEAVLKLEMRAEDGSRGGADAPGLRRHSKDLCRCARDLQRRATKHT